MPQMIIRHEVEDYDKWKKLFDASSIIRKTNGEKGCNVFRNSSNPNDIAIVFEWDDVQKAMRFAQSEDLRSAMKQAGVLTQPHVYLTDEDLSL